MRRLVAAILAVCAALGGGGVALAHQLPLAELGSAILRAESGDSPAAHQYRPPPGPGPGVERIAIECQAEWDPRTGQTSLYFFAPDTPQIPLGVSGQLPWAGADGTGLFTPSGRMGIVCTGNGWNPAGGLTFTLPWMSDAGCLLYRGGADFSTVGARVYTGRGRLVISTTGAVRITCHGAFAGISTGPTTPPTPP